MHAAHLVAEIKALDSSIKFSGLGGPRMQKAGVLLYENIVDFAVVGFVEVLKHLKEFKRVFRLVLSKAQETKPDAVILVDYPGFNLRLAKELKKQGCKVIYYISPQVWAWKENRVELIRQFTDEMLVLFKFEEEFYAKHGLAVDFVGHPLLDSIKVSTSREELLKSVGFSKNKLTIGILPGSREKEVEKLLPIMIDTANLLYKENKNFQFLILQAPTMSERIIDRYLSHTTASITVIKDQTHNGISACDACMVASGTATLETAILGKPMVVVYKTSFVTWALAKIFVKIPYIGLVNVVAGKKIVPECIQFDATAKNIGKEIRAIFDDPSKMARMKSDLAKIKPSLGAPGACARAAEKILQTLGD